MTELNNQKKSVAFLKKNVKVQHVLSSEWCRCKDTAFHAFSNYKTFNALNSFYSEKFYNNKNKQIKNLKKFISDWDNNSNLILVTHYVVIFELLGIGAKSGEIIISNKKYEIIDRIEINWLFKINIKKAFNNFIWN